MKFIFQESKMVLTVLAFLFFGIFQANNNLANSKNLALPNFTMSLSKTDMTCLGNGIITANFSTLSDGSTLDILLYTQTGTVILQSTSFTVSGSTATFTFSGLNAGNYRVEAKQTLSSESNTQIATITVLNKVASLAATVTKTKEVCNVYELTTNVTAGNPDTYTLINKSTGAIVKPEQASNIFSNVAPGTYTVRIKDVCGNILNFDAPPLANNTYTLNLQTSSGTTQMQDCNNIKFWHNLGGNIAYPVQLTYSVTSPIDGTVTTTTPVSVTYPSTHNAILPYYKGYNYNINITGVDACGTVYNATKAMQKNSTPDIVYNLTASACGGQYLRVTGLDYFYGTATIEILSAPAGFVPSVYSSAFTGTNTVGTFSIASYINLGSSTQPLPTGNYQIKITDECGTTKTIIANVSTTAYTAKKNATLNNTGCALGYGSVVLEISASSGVVTSNITKGTITSAPASFTQTLPYEVPNASPSSIYGTDGRLYLNNYPDGDYTIILENNCTTPFTLNFTITGKIVEKADVTVTPGCSNFNVDIDYKANTNFSRFILQKYFPASGLWGHPNTGSTSTIFYNGISATVTNGIAGYSNGSASMINPKATVSNNQTGKFRIVLESSSGFLGGVASNQNCYEVLKEFEYYYEPKINDYYTFQCQTGGKINVVVDAQGVNPLNYEIVQKDGVAFALNNGTNPVFTSLDPAIYKIKVTDGCTNVTYITVSGTTSKLPIIKPSNLCDGQNGKLYIDGLNFMTITWTKGTDPTVLATGNTLNFTPYNTVINAGTYYAHISYAGNDVNCSNQALSFTINPVAISPEAGNGQTVTVLQNSVTSALNLFDYITPPYDNYGNFTAVSPVVNPYLASNNFDAVSAPTGDYQFLYTVNGTCSGTDTTTITIHLTGSCTQDPATGTAILGNVVGISSINIQPIKANPENTKGWPEDVNNAYLVLASKNKGFVLTRTTSSAITTPSEGMLIWDTTDKCIKLYNGTTWNCIQKSCNN